MAPRSSLPRAAPAILKSVRESQDRVKELYNSSARNDGGDAGHRETIRSELIRSRRSSRRLHQSTNAEVEFERREASLLASRRQPARMDGPQQPPGSGRRGSRKMRGSRSFA